MIAKKKVRVVAFVLAAGVLPLAVFVVPLYPWLLAATSWWYGYQGKPVFPDALTPGGPLHRLSERRNSVIPDTGSLVQYVNGVIRFEAEGVSAPSIGFGLSLRPTYNNNHEWGETADDGNADLPNGWNWHTGVFQLADMGSGQIRCVGRGHSATKYVLSGSTYYGKLGADSKIIRKPEYGEFWLLGTNGTTATFYDFDSSRGGKVGALKTIYDPYGRTLGAEYYTAAENWNLQDLLKRLRDYSAGLVWKYTYIDNTGNANNRRIQKLELRDGTEDGSYVLASAEYTYYDPQSGQFAAGSGTTGDLMRVVVKERDSTGGWITRTSQFRYWTGSYSQGNPGGAHRLKYALGPEARARLEAAVADPLKATDAELGQFADLYLEYGPGPYPESGSLYVKKAVVRGGGCSCSGGAGTYTYSYARNSSWTPSSAPSVWKTCVTQTNPDGTVRIVDVSGTGAILNDVFQNSGTGQRWITHYEFDSAGRITEIYRPSVCASYSEQGHTVTYKSPGLIERFAYENGNLVARRVKNGPNGAEYLLESVGYTERTLGSNTVYYPTSRTLYPVGEASDPGHTTTFGYSFYSDKFGVWELQVTQPTVPYDQNGGGSEAPAIHNYYFNSSGQLVWERDEVGSITYRAYHTDPGGPDFGTLVREIRDLDTDDFSPAPPTGYTNSSGLSLETTYAYEADGKLSEIVDPSGRREVRHYAQFLWQPSENDPALPRTVVLTYPHIEPEGQQAGKYGPVSIAVYDLDGRLVDGAVGDPTYRSNPSPAVDFDGQASTLEAAFAGDLYERTSYVYEDGQKTREVRWTDAGDPGATQYVTQFGYDAMGRLARVKDPLGTIRRTVYTARGQVRSRWVGTNDRDWPYGDPPGEPSGTYDMTKVEERFYDDEEDSSTNVGDGNLTREKRFVDGSSSRDVDYSYDWRDRRTKADGEESYFEKLEYDNLDRVTVRSRYAGSDQYASYLRAKAETKYDVLGRAYEEVVYEVSPTTGAVGDGLPTKFWYDARGGLLKTREPSGLFRKQFYDGAGRVRASYVSYDSDEASYAAAGDVSGDTVVSQVYSDRDELGNVVLETRFERKANAGDWEGPLTPEKGVRFYVARWYDVLGRLVARADYGTNGGSALTRPPSPPARGDTVLVTSWEHDDVGRLVSVTGPGGHVTRRGYDHLGRLVSEVWNYVDGTPGPGDDDRAVELEYDAVSHVTKRKTWMTSTSDPEETGYVWGVSKGSLPASAIASGDLLQAVKHPDRTSGSPSESASDQERFAYNAQGEAIYRVDGRGVVHEYVYDELGRRTADKVTALPDGVDDWVRRIQTSYDALDRVTHVTSYGSASGGTVRNQVFLVYNGFGQVVESWQSHNGTAGTGTPSVKYGYSECEEDPVSRLRSIQYPATGRKVYVYYDDPSGGEDHEKLDWTLVRPSGFSNSSSPTGSRIADYTYQGLGRVVGRVAEDPSTDVSVSYGYDRFGRVSNLIASSASYFNQFAHGYDRDSRLLWREEYAGSGKDELYGYDDLGRLVAFKRGDLNGERTDIESPVRSQSWSLDLLGNWESVTTDGDEVGRTHNRANEIVDVDTGETGGDPAYDAEGNTTYASRPAPTARTYVYDAWNRVRKVLFGQGATVVAEYEYDGLGRRVRDGVADRDYYYDESWRLLSERDGPDVAVDKTLREYAWGVAYVDEILSRDEDRNGDGDTLDGDDQSLYYVQDANWNVVTLCGESGAPVERVVYDPYGLPSFFDGSWGTRSSSLYGNAVLSTGRLWNPVTFAYDYRHREESPYLGRFLQRDPLGAWGDPAGGGNAYGYVGGSPMTRRDPTGMLSVKHCLILSDFYSKPVLTPDGTVTACKCEYDCTGVQCPPGYLQWGPITPPGKTVNPGGVTTWYFAANPLTFCGLVCLMNAPYIECQRLPPPPPGPSGIGEIPAFLIIGAGAAFAYVAGFFGQAADLVESAAPAIIRKAPVAGECVLRRVAGILFIIQAVIEFHSPPEWPQPQPMA